MSCAPSAWLEQALPIWLQLPHLCYLSAKQNAGIVDLGGVFLEDIFEGIFYSYEFYLLFFKPKIWLQQDNVICCKCQSCEGTQVQS